MPSAKRPFPYHFSPPFLDPIFFLMVRRTWYDPLRLPLGLSRVSGCEIRVENRGLIAPRLNLCKLSMNVVGIQRRERDRKELVNHN